MSTVLITQEMFQNMNYDTQNTTSNNNNKKQLSTGVSGDESSKPTVLVVFANSDINAALYHLVKSLENPFDSKAIATVIVQESIKNDFIKKLQQQIKPYDVQMIKNNKQYLNALDTIKKLSAQTVTAEKVKENSFNPTLVCDFTHEHFGISPPSGIVTLHTFRTAKEAASLVSKEPLKFSYTSIWHENHSYAYELIAAIKSEIFFINCNQVSLAILEESIAQCKNIVVMEKSYHYETLQHDGVQKSIVFPIGSIFAN